MITYNNQMRKTGEILCELLSEALGFGLSYLKDTGSVEEMTIRNSHYPESPHPKLTIGVTIRSDPGFVTMLIEDRIVASKSFVKINGLILPQFPGL